MSWQFEQLVPPIGLTEGPAWDGGGLLFTNIPNSRILRWDPATRQWHEFRSGTNRCNGLMLDKAGQLYGCEGGWPETPEIGRRIVRYEEAHQLITPARPMFEMALAGQGLDVDRDPRELRGLLQVLGDVGVGK